MRFIIIISLLITTNEAFTQINTGIPISSDFMIIDTSSFIMTSSASLERAYLISYQGIKYKLCVDNNRLIKSIFVSDKKFRTPDGVSVGMKYESIKDDLQKEECFNQSGWASYCILKSGWKVAFSYKKRISDRSKIVFIFKEV